MSGGDAAPFGTYSLGVHATDIAPHLAEHGALRIIGYRRSGKSTLAEVLAFELRRSGQHVLVQNASSWLAGRGYVPGRQGGDATVDPELRQALSTLNGFDCPTWIVDDADVLAAYASEETLAAIGRQVRAGLLSLVLIRNRFVVESGSLRRRESLIAPGMPSLELDALDAAASLQVCTMLMEGADRLERAHWLAEMTGGVPGLISDLLPLCPRGGPQPRHEAVLMRRVEAAQRELLTGDTDRAAVLTGLHQRTLPPLSLLTAERAAEVGALIAAGMVHFRYWRVNSPFRGRFWSLVAGATGLLAEPGLRDSEMVGLELESAIRGSGLHEPVVSALELQDNSEGALALAFSQALYWSDRDGAPSCSLSGVLAECLGAVHLRALLRSWTGEQPSDVSGPRELAQCLIDLAARR